MSKEHAQVVVNPFVICGGALILAVLTQWALPLPFLPAPLAWVLGVIVFLTGVGFGLPAARHMRQVKTTLRPNRSSTALVTTGPFRFSRNPIYIAMVFNYAGLAIILGTPWGLLFLPLVVWLLTRWVIIPEEDYLKQQFGESYQQYQAGVRRWI